MWGVKDALPEQVAHHVTPIPQRPYCALLWFINEQTEAENILYDSLD